MNYASAYAPSMNNFRCVVLEDTPKHFRHVRFVDTQIHKFTQIQDLLSLLEIRSVERGICPIATSSINERTVPIIMAGCMAHERDGYISTSGLKSDVTSCYSTRFPLRCANFGDSAINKRYIAYFLLRMRETAVFPLPV